MARKQPNKSNPQTPQTSFRRPAPDATAPAQARTATDRGQTGDKVAADDPAAAPLETDAEASGTATSSQAAAASNEDQVRVGAKARTAEAAFARTSQPGKANQTRRMVLGAAVIVLVLLGVLVGLGLL